MIFYDEKNGAANITLKTKKPKGKINFFELTFPYLSFPYHFSLQKHLI